MKAILFLTFQTVQEMHKELALQTFLHFLPINELCQPNSISLIDEGNTQDTLNRVKNISKKILSLHSEGCDLWILHGPPSLLENTTPLFLSHTSH